LGALGMLRRGRPCGDSGIRQGVLLGFLLHIKTDLITIARAANRNQNLQAVLPGVASGYWHQ
jgi:hypothetical protein